MSSDHPRIYGISNVIILANRPLNFGVLIPMSHFRNVCGRCFVRILRQICDLIKKKNYLFPNWKTRKIRTTRRKHYSFLIPRVGLQLSIEFVNEYYLDNAYKCESGFIVSVFDNGTETYWSLMWVVTDPC